jgi:cytochrome c peroxidase
MILRLLLAYFCVLNFAVVDAAVDKKALQAQAKAIFPHLQAHSGKQTDLIKLGKRLFMDTNLSANNAISCNSCHDLKKFGVDGKKTSPGHMGQLGGRNSPTVYNAFFHVSQFWDGRAKDVEEQALGPILNPVEMAMPNEAAVIEKLKKIKTYVADFGKSFPGEKDPLNYKNLGKAIGAFERTLATPARFDKFLQGDLKALTEAEAKGLQTFMNKGCTACHAGQGLGGHMYQKIGLVKAYATTDLGRFVITKNESEKYYFKVPSLRNIAKTAPYFHDGSVATLEEAVTLMGRHQLGVELSKVEVAEITSFLNSLTGKI